MNLITVCLFAVLLIPGQSSGVEVKTPDIKGAVTVAADGTKLSGARARSDIKADTDKNTADVKGAADKAKGDVKTKIIDINAAGAAELRTIPGIGEAYAAKIIAGRPYANKAQLKSRNILPVTVYEQVKDLIIARQPVK